MTSLILKLASTSLSGPFPTHMTRKWKKLSILRTKRNFKIKWKIFLTVFKRISLKQAKPTFFFFFSPTLTSRIQLSEIGKQLHQYLKKYRPVDNETCGQFIEYNGRNIFLSKIIQKMRHGEYFQTFIWFLKMFDRLAP